MGGNGISMNYPPREIFTGCHMDFKKNCKVVFALYLVCGDIWRHTTTR